MLEYASFQIKIPTGGKVNVTKELSINSIPCLVSFEEEACIRGHKLRSFLELTQCRNLMPVRKKVLEGSDWTLWKSYFFFLFI